MATTKIFDFLTLNSISSIVFLIAGIALVYQAFVGYLYVDRTPESFFNKVSDDEERKIKLFFNIILLIGGIGVGAIVTSVYSLISSISKSIALLLYNTLIFIVAAISVFYIWFLIPGKISTKADSVSGKELEDILLASSFAFGTFGFFIGLLIFSNIKYLLRITQQEGVSFEDETLEYILAIELIIISLVLLVQSIIYAILYFSIDEKDNRTFFYYTPWIGFGVLSILLIILSVVFLFV